MAKQTTVTLIDDIDESPAAETVQFGWKGQDLEIDLSEANAARLRELLAPFQAAARVVRGGKRAGSSSAASPATDRSETRAARTWARENGWENLSDRGRIPAEAWKAYRERNKPSASVTPIRPATVAEAKAAKAGPPPVQNGDDAAEFVATFVENTRKHTNVKAAVAASKAPKKAAESTKAGLPKVKAKPKGVRVQAMTAMQTRAVEDLKIPTHEVGQSVVVFKGDSPTEVLAKIRAAMQNYDGSKTSGAYASMAAVIRKLELADPKKVKVVEVEAA